MRIRLSEKSTLTSKDRKTEKHILPFLHSQCTACHTNIQQYGNPPKDGGAYLKITYFILQWDINLDAVIQSKAQRLWPVTGSPGFSQAWVWTRAAWFNLISDKKQQAFGTPPRSTSTPHNIISSSTQGVRSTVAVRGEICFHFTTSVAEKTIQMLLYFPHYCSLVWISPLSLLLPSDFLQYTHSRGSLVTASHYYPETAAQQSYTANVPHDTTHIPTLPSQAVCRANRIWQWAQF